MIFIRNNPDFTISEPTVLTLGKFDGLHMGHKKILEHVAKKQTEGLKSVIFTFDAPPSASLTDSPVYQLTTLPEKELCFSNVGIDYFYESPFTDEIRLMSPRSFVKMCVDRFHVKCFVVGTDCKFGHKRAGDYNMLYEMAPGLGFEVVVVEKKQYEGRDISSTFIREEINKGNIEKANMLLGYPFFIMGKIKHGQSLGHTLGFPTLNIYPQEDKLLPPFGVYASRTVIGDRIIDGVTNIGVRPTVGGESVSVETNLFDFDEDVYGKEVRVRLYSYIRPERKFASLDELKSAIEDDKAEAVHRLRETLINLI